MRQKIPELMTPMFRPMVKSYTNTKTCLPGVTSHPFNVYSEAALYRNYGIPLHPEGVNPVSAYSLFSPALFIGEQSPIDLEIE